MEDMKSEIAAQDFLTGMTKIRWTRMGMDPDEIVRMRRDSEMEDEDKKLRTYCLLAEIVFSNRRQNSCIEIPH